MPTTSNEVCCPDPSLQTSTNLAVGIRRGLSRRCPACGKGPLFDGYLSIRPTCPVCGNYNGRYPSDDFAPYLTIFLVLHILTPVLFFVDRAWTPSMWLEMAIAVPLFLAASAAVLPFAKGAIIGLAWAYNVTREGSK